MVECPATVADDSPTDQLPGGATNAPTLTFENVGTANVSTFTIESNTCSCAPAGTYRGNVPSAESCGEVDIAIGSCASVCFHPSKPTEAGAALATTYTLTNPYTDGTITAGSGLDARSSDAIAVRTDPDSTATNPDQRLQAARGFNFTVNQ